MKNGMDRRGLVIWWDGGRLLLDNHVAAMLTRKGIPFERPQSTKKPFTPRENTIKVLTMHSSKGLEFPLVCIPATGMVHRNDEAPEDEARLLYVAMTRATRQLVMTYGKDSRLVEKLREVAGEAAV
jgi:superfamily I DNA/RNA helicase